VLQTEAIETSSMSKVNMAHTETTEVWKSFVKFPRQNMWRNRKIFNLASDSIKGIIFVTNYNVEEKNDTKQRLKSLCLWWEPLQFCKKYSIIAENNTYMQCSNARFLVISDQRSDRWVSSKLALDTILCGGKYKKWDQLSMPNFYASSGNLAASGCKPKVTVYLQGCLACKRCSECSLSGRYLNSYFKLKLIELAIELYKEFWSKMNCGIFHGH